MSVFEIAAISGMAAGFITVGIVWDRLGLLAFYLVIALYAISYFTLLGVGGGRSAGGTSEHKIKLSFLKSARAMRLVPAWIAVNAVLGVWLTHSALQMKRPDDPSQLLVGGFTGQEISYYGATTLLLFVAGIGIWGFVMGRIGALRTMTLSLGGLIVMSPALYLLNRSMPEEKQSIYLWLTFSAIGLFGASGFTPAALAYLSKVAEEHASERGAIRGLYSVLLGVGQAIGALSGGYGADRGGINGMIALTALFTVAACIAVAGLVRVDRGLSDSAQTAHDSSRLASEPAP